MTKNRRGRMVSLEARLPLLVGSVMFLVMAALTLASYLVATNAERTAAAVRIERDAGVAAARIQTGIRGTLVPGRALAKHPDVQAFLASPSKIVARDAVESALEYRGPRPEIVLLTELLDASGNRLAAVGPSPSGPPRLSADELAAAQQTGVGAIRDVSGVPVFPAVADVQSEGVRVAWIVTWWHLAMSLRVDSGTIYVGNRGGGVWTDLRGIVEAPPMDITAGPVPLRYSRATIRQLAATAPVVDTPWLVVVETPENIVLASTRQFVTQVAVFALLLFVLGSLGVWFLSRRITKPLRRLTHAAAAISAGDYTAQVMQVGDDEIGQLSASFNNMAERVQAAHRRSEEQTAQYQMLFESNPSPMWVFDRESLRFLAVNRAARQTYGYTTEEFLERTIKDIRPEPEVPRLLRDLAESQTGLDFGGRWVHRRKDGTTLSVEITSHDVLFQGRRAALVLAQNVTARESAEQALQSAHETLRAIVDEAPVAIYSLDTAGMVRSWNPAAERIFGWTATEALGKSLQTISPDALPDPAGRVQEVATGQLLKGAELIRQRKDGASVSVRVYAAPMHDPAGAVTGIMVVAADTTDFRRLEQQFRQAQKMEAVGRLAGGIAHDFNNILTVILGESEMALQETADDDLNRPALEAINNAGIRAAQLTRQLLAFSRQQIVERTVFDLNHLVLDVERMLERLIGENVQMQARLSHESVVVHADRSQLEQVLINLVVNARDAMPNGGMLSIETAVLHLQDLDAMSHGLRPGRYCVLSVSDSGCGMTEEIRSHIFEPFFTTKGAGRGTGLGLATCYGIVSQAEGHIEVYSEPDVGTTFRVYLPQTASEDGTYIEAAVPGATRGSECILLVEDQVGVRDVAARMLSGLGYRVLTAADGETAMDMLSEAPTEVDLLLTDVVLPGMSGGELARRARVRHPNLKVLFASGYTGDVAAYQALVDADSALLQKPFTAAALGTRVRQILDV